MGRKLWQIAAFQDSESCKAAFMELQDKGYIRYEYLSLKASDGRLIDVEFVSNAYQAGSLKVIQCNIRDITECKLAHEALSQLASIVEGSDDAIIGKTLEGTIVNWNRSAERIFGYTAAEVKGRSLSILAPPDRPDELPQILERIKKGERVDPFETVRLKKDGTRMDVSISISPVRNETDQIVGASTIERDITEHKQAEAALLRSEEQYRELFESANDAIYTTDLRGSFTSFNKMAEQLSGYSREEAMQMNMDHLLAPEFVERGRQEIQRILEGGSPGIIEIEILAKDGHRVALEANDRILLQDGKVIGIQGIARDISERKKLEAQLRQAQKMEAIGRLAGGVAHDFNNLLGVILGYGELLLEHSDSASPQRQQIEEIKKAAERGASLTRQLLAFSRKQVLEARVLDINAVVDESEKLVRHLIGENIELTAILKSRLGRVKADLGQIEQVIMNLVINAKDAMPQGGKLTIETADVELDEGYARAHAEVRPGSYVMLAVSDTGAGMEREIQTHIFEPFFTTKAPGAGTGLGLSTVYGIVRQSNGHISVYSEPGKGTTFKIYLPRVEQPLEALESPMAARSLDGSETILLVEDEPSLRELGREFLEQNGYLVLEAKNPAEAIQVAEQHIGTIHLLLTDVVMPGMNGRQLAEHLSASRPYMKVIYMSGYTDDAIVNLGVLENGINFLGKPFAREALLRKVRDVLEGKKAEWEKKDVCHV